MDYMFCVRKVRGGAYINEPGATHFLAIPEASLEVSPDHRIRKRDWIEAVIQEAVNGQNMVTLSLTGDIVFYVHGFNTEQRKVLERHRLLRKGLEAEGWQGAVVSFDWPSASSALNYLEDRTDAKQSALRLVDEGIRSFAAIQRTECEINMHVFAHSMGAYVVREAFDDADDRPAIASHAWTVSQTVIVSGDVSAGSMADGHAKSSSLYRHSVRLTNYSNPFDDVLSISNVKRVGVAPRVGRIGLPLGAPGKAVNVNTGDYFEAHRARFAHVPNAAHSWYFHDPMLMRDVAFTLNGHIDRASIPTRVLGPSGLQLRL